MLLLLKIITLMFWLLAGLVWWEGYEVFFLQWVPKVALVLLAIHLVEAVVFWVAFRAKSRFPRLELIMVLLFGVLHMYRYMKKEQRVANF